MTRPRFRPTHELTLTNRNRRGVTVDEYPPPLRVRVMLLSSGTAYAADEYACPNALPTWQCLDGVWHWRGHADRLPTGYTTLRVRRLGRRGRTAMGPTVIRGATRRLTLRFTEEQDLLLQEEAERDGKKPATWAAEVVVGELERRKRRR